MSSSVKSNRYRLLIIDDNRAIHEDFRKILAPDIEPNQLNEIEADLFGKAQEISTQKDFELDSAFQGEEGLSLVQHALEEGRPYVLAFVDMRMPPGWNGIETIEHIWKIDPLLQIVICSAYSDHSWAEISQRLGNNDRLLILKKPFDNIEILQMAYAMSKKCELARKHQLPVEQSEPEKNGSSNNVHQLGSLQKTSDIELRGSIEEIADSIYLLQKSFEELTAQLNKLRAAINEKNDSLSEGAVQKLFTSPEVPDFEKQIPDTFHKLHSALKKLST